MLALIQKITNAYQCAVESGFKWVVITLSKLTDLNMLIRPASDLSSFQNQKAIRTLLLKYLVANASAAVLKNLANGLCDASMKLNSTKTTVL